MSLSDWTRLAEHIQALEAVSPAARARYIENVAASDPAVAQELRSLIPFAERTSGPIDETATLAGGSSALPDLAGRSIGVYEIVEKIGAGGMGVVYRARRSDEQFEKDVAVKFLSHAALDGEGHRRFLQERRILARLDHPHIARLLDAGALDAIGPYVVMELVEGQPIDTYCEEHKLSLDERLTLFQKVCEAVQSAHQQLIVHRDLKPSNVLVEGTGLPKLLDFGIAKMLSDDGSGDEQRPATLLMTPRYAAPEQIAGEPVTTSTDVYALGVLLYKLLTGESPYNADDSDLMALQRAILEGDTRSVSYVAKETRRDPTYRRALEGDIDNIVSMAMQRDPRQRYASAAELAEDIENYVTGMPVRARPATRSYRLRKFLRRHRASATGVVLVLLALAGGSVATWIQARAALAARDQAERRYGEMRELSEALIFDVNDDLAKIPGTTEVRRGLVARALQYLEKLRGEVADNEELASSVAGAYLRVGDLQGHPSFDNLGDSEGAKRSYAAGMEICREYGVTETSSVTLRNLCATLPLRRALLEYFNGDLAVGAKLIEEHRSELFELSREHPEDPRYLIQYTDALRLLGQIYSWSAKSDDAIATFEEAIEIYEQARRDHPDVSQFAGGLAGAYAMLGSELTYADRTEEGLAFLRKAVATEKERADRFPDDADVQRGYWYSVANLAIESIQAGQANKAVAPGRLSLEIAQALYQRDPKSHRSQQDLATARRYLGKALVASGDPARGRPYLEQAISWWRQQHAAAPTSNTSRSVALISLDLADALRGLREKGRERGLLSTECNLLRESLRLLEDLRASNELAEVDLDWIKIVGKRLEECP